MKRRPVLTIFLTLLLTVFYLFIYDLNEQSSFNHLEKVKVIRVVDGDTFVISNKQRIRLIGINTPETVHPEKEVEYYGKEASDFTKKSLEGKYIFLESDIQDKDKYKRLLRYVFLEDGTFFNELLVKEGYAKVVTYPPNVKYQEVLLEAQRVARENDKGLWNR